MARILLIEDEPQLGGALRHMLEQAGYDVVEARNGCEGVQRFRAMPPDLVITDIFMPEQEGLETIRILRQTCPAIKIIAISGGGQKRTLNFLSVAEKLGAQRTLWKPFRRQELLEAVRELLGEDTAARTC
jgi:CheY-like chemotaxis protein